MLTITPLAMSLAPPNVWPRGRSEAGILAERTVFFASTNAFHEYHQRACLFRLRHRVRGDLFGSRWQTRQIQCGQSKGLLSNATPLGHWPPIIALQLFHSTDLLSSPSQPFRMDPAVPLVNLEPNGDPAAVDPPYGPQRRLKQRHVQM